MASKVKFDMPDFSLALKKATERTIEEAGFAIEAEAKQTAPVNSGFYRNNINFDGKNKVIANASYSADLEYGTQPHIIETKTAKALHFKSGVNDVFAQKVHHPGTKPQAIMRNAAKKVQKLTDDFFYRNWKRIARKYAGE